MTPAYNVNQTHYQIDGLANFFKPRSSDSFAFSSRVKLSPSEARSMADEFISSLHVLDAGIKGSIDVAAADMARCNKDSSRKKRMHYKRIKELMQEQLGATEVIGQREATSTVYYIEPSGAWNDDEEEGGVLYLCRSVCNPSDPINTWTSERLMALSAHAVGRAFMRRCAWATGYAVTAECLVKVLVDVYAGFQSAPMPEQSAYPHLSHTKWLVQFSLEETQFVIECDEAEVPRIRTVFATREGAPESGEIKVLPAKRRSRLFHLL
ncbi:hypothetical protein A3742_01275 [Oleiphilus sp. HI0071]|nr:hypothetical protein A3737_01185 [Oleiphilus sp. HI0065]KZY82007.1 hypothetical protein A3742_01275 [Oleiphilus sp. HI0071]KZY91137.1 hypothetical protein A3744_04530 [Oleiphilus sp. HI0073]KZZ10589.1 hypothetical protein A3750_07620 [Oleiphilus sp. HI0079]KZZ16221.1 hypothetical protein A3751_15380 [Oleiphilus sp. HI0080]KZZ42159.1 hypothetical protein A3758_06175 [Oleiphilus sp. HI0118]KZZ60393.1 hypothetical protein A3760_05895 [Oleiphilus sp. HI0122]KZZ64802.1 hypothetical protein A37